MRKSGYLAAVTLGLGVVLTSLPSAGQDILDRNALIGRLVPITGDVQRSVDLTVPFALGAAKLTRGAEQQLNELGEALAGEKLRRFRFGVYGHTDASGRASYNLMLSKQRAAAVVAYLVGQFSFDSARIEHKGYGEERLLEGVESNSPRQRRVEIVVFAPKQPAKPVEGLQPDKGESCGFRSIN
ncbi:MAG: OmpA family protein [Proteobacteria bacterium]|nr:OmpA family protein [Pseudomonadota bacterium]